LGAAMIAGLPCRVNSKEGIVLTFEPQHPRLRAHHQDEGWVFPEDEAQALGRALIEAAEGAPTATSTE
jgi:hypothetical protein